MSPKVDFMNKVLARIDRLDRESVQSYVSGLIREKELNSEILDRIDEGIVLLSRNGVVKFANRRAFLWLGFQRLFGDRSQIKDLIEDLQIKAFIQDCLKQPDQASSYEFEVLSPRELVLRVHWVPLPVDEERFILLRIENLTRERTHGEETAQAFRVESLTRLAAGVAHEIGNPLNSIQIHIELLKREIEKLPKETIKKLAKYLDVTSAETKRLDQIVRSFLRVTRRPPLRFRKESINDVLEEAVEFLRPEMERQKIQAKVLLDKKLTSFLLDKDRLYQAFLNLIKNAMEAMPNGGMLRISSSVKGKGCFILFEDVGQGIAEDHLPHIFEPYYTTKAEGSGLGLSQVYQAVREHGGRIDVKSEAGKGTMFTLVFPIRTERLCLPQGAVTR